MSFHLHPLPKRSPPAEDQKQCPKCHYIRQASDHAPDWQCPQCHIAYDKMEVVEHSSSDVYIHERQSRIPTFVWLLIPLIILPIFFIRSHTENDYVIMFMGFLLVMVGVLMARKKHYNMGFPFGWLMFGWGWFYYQLHKPNDQTDINASMRLFGVMVAISGAILFFIGLF